MSRQQATAFVTAVEALPAAQREAFLLHVDGELTLQQMATVTAVGIETLKSRLRYATRRVRAACAEWLEPPVRWTGGPMAAAAQGGLAGTSERADGTVDEGADAHDDADEAKR